MTTTLTRPAGPPAPTPAATRPARRGSLLLHAVVLARRGLIKTARTPEALLDVTLQPIIFLLLFTYIFGGAVGAATGGSREAYLQMLLPAMLGQMIAMGSIAVGVNLNTDLEKGVFDRFRSLPIARSAPLVGAVFADFVRYLVLFVCTMSVGMLMGFDVKTNALAVLAALGISIAFALCFCWFAVWVGMLARTPGAVQGIGFLVLFPLGFGSNTYVPTATLPGWMQSFVKVNPLTHLADVERGLMLGGPVAKPLLWTVGWMVGLVVVFAPLALRAYNRRA